MCLSIVCCVFVLIMCVADTETFYAYDVLPEKCMSHSQQGDIVLGGVFPLRLDSRPVPCRGGLSPWGVRLSEAMIFAVDEINRRDDLLPNVTLGFDLRDDCRSEEVALWTALSLIRNSSVSFPEKQDCAPETVGRVTGIVGTGFSETSIYVAKTASLFQVPVVSYAASSDELSDKSSYPYFLRTYPPDSLQVKVILDVLLHFNWEYIGLLYSLESDGIRGAFALQELAEEVGVCVAFSSPIPEFASDNDLQSIIEKLKTHSKVEVVILFGATNEAQSVLGAVKESSLRKIVWIGTTHWGYLLSENNLQEVASGALFVRDFRPKVAAFGEYFTTLDPSSQHVSPWFKEMAQQWLATQNCSDLSICPLYRGNTEGLVINSVYAFAHAIDTLLRQKCSGNHCQQNRDLEIDGASLLYTLKTIQFNGPYGRVSFDSNGDGRGKYVLSNLQHIDGEYRIVDVGWWDAINETRLWLSDDMIQWPDNNLTPPQSACRETCLPGYAVTTLRQRCCLGCTKCPNNNIVVNDTLCFPCENSYWPDENSEFCVPIVPTNIQLGNPLVVSILAVVICGLVSCLLTSLGLVAKRRHHLVKATSRELTCIHFMGLILSYISGLILLTATPSSTACIASEFIISISFTMTYAPTLLKVIRIHRIFTIGRVTAQRPGFTSPKSQVVVIGIIVVTQIGTSILSGLLAPSTPVNLYTIDMGNYSEVFCAFGYGFIASCSLNLVIITACCYFAFLARNVPDNYNESRFIAVSVYSTLVLCIATIPVYTTTHKVLPKVATISMAVLLNAYVSLVCLYLTKLCAIVCENQVKPVDAGPATAQLQLEDTATAHASTSRMPSTLLRPVKSAWGSESKQYAMSQNMPSSSESNKA